jgi:hypothetical protein
VDVGVVVEVLPPRVQHGEHADLGPEVPRVARDGEQRLGDGTEEKPVDETLVLQCDRADRVRKREDDVKVWHREEIAFLILEPLCAGARSALRTVAIPAGNGVHTITCLMGSDS